MISLFAIFCFGLTIAGVVFLGIRNAAEVSRREALQREQSRRQRLEQQAKLNEEFVELREKVVL